MKTPMSDPKILFTVTYSKLNTTQFYDYVHNHIDHPITIGPTKNEFDNNGNSRTLSLLPREVVNHLIGLNDPNFKMSIFNLRDNHFPRRFESMRIFIPLPETCTAQQCRDHITMNMNLFVEYGWIRPNDYRLNIPVDSQGNHRRMSFIVFNRQVPDYKIVVTKMLLHKNNSFFRHGFEEVIKCYWAKRRRRGPPSARSTPSAQPTDGCDSNDSSEDSSENKEK